MLPPFLPYQYYMYLKKAHFTKDRFFPYEYVEEVLSKGISYDVKANTTLEEVVAYIKSKGIDYEKIHQEKYDSYGEIHKKLANWDPHEFEGIMVDNVFYKLDFTKNLAVKDEPTTSPTTSPTTVSSTNDKLILQNYGRPYHQNRPDGTYYRYVKSIELFPEFEK